MTHPVDQHVGNRLKRARVMRRLSQTEVARQVNISFQQVQKYEVGANRISASRLFELAQILKVDPGFFFEDLDESGNTAQTDDDNANIVKAVAAIEDDRVKERIIALISDLSGVTVGNQLH